MVFFIHIWDGLRFVMCLQCCAYDELGAELVNVINNLKYLKKRMTLNQNIKLVQSERQNTGMQASITFLDIPHLQ